MSIAIIRRKKKRKKRKRKIQQKIPSADEDVATLGPVSTAGEMHSGSHSGRQAGCFSKS